MGKVRANDITLCREVRRGNESGSDGEGGLVGGRKQRMPMTKGEVDYRVSDYTLTRSGCVYL